MKLAAILLTSLFYYASFAAAPVHEVVVPPTKDAEPTNECFEDAKRELNDYFRKESRAPQFYMTLQNLPLLEPAGTLRGVYYFWVRASTSEGQFYRTGVAHVAQREGATCDVTGFISKHDILAHRTQLEAYFPSKLIPKILLIANTPQK